MNRLQSIRQAATPTLSDSVNNALPTRSIYFNASGTVRLLLVDNGTTTTDYAVTVGQRLPVSAIRINATGTTIAASNIVLEF